MPTRPASARNSPATCAAARATRASSRPSSVCCVNRPPPEFPMQLEQAFTLAAAPDTVWTAFHDVRLLVDCLPGASLRDTAEAPVEGAEIPLLFKVKLGPIAAGFSGQGRIVLDEA